MNSEREEERRRADPQSTHDLAARARGGDVKGFRELYEHVAPSLYAWARVRSRPAQGITVEPEDLLQEVWLRAFENLRDFDATQGSFRAWIFGIAKNVAYESWRRRSPTPQSPEASATASAALDAWPDVKTSVRTRMSRDESVAKLVEQLESFDPIDRELLVHCGMEDVSSNVVATRLGMGKDAVAKRWQRLRERLRGGAFADWLEL
jgi:RNA polymerase sigma-70 factor (ECF subfamily)